MIKLYFKEKTRATRPHWLLEELAELGGGPAYERVSVDFAGGENRRPEYLRLHPHGLVPALVDGETTIFETAAICLYLADRFIEQGLAPPFGSPLRAPYYQWVAYCPATLEPAIGQYARHTRMLPEPERVPRLAEDGRRRFQECADVLTAALKGREFLVGDCFTTADLLVGGNLLWARRVGLLDAGSPLDDYLNRLLDRPAARRVFDAS